LNSQDFEFIAQLLRKRAGVVLTGDKMYLLESRLAPLARKEGLPSIDDLIHVVRARREERLIAQVVDVMTTNETYFFRDRAPFDYLKETILPAFAQARRGSRIRIWSAACSTGQEAYSIVMMLEQNPQITQGVPVEIVASDISDRCLERARQGLFTQFEIQRGLPIQFLMQYFTQQDDHWRISERMRNQVTFRKQNLIEQTASLGMFDIVLCRNVITYFDGPTKTEVLARIGKQLNPNGFLVLGVNESVVGLSTDFDALQDRRGVFQLSSRAVKAA
jgi:chemotaxis protein methyltransferase CheR